ncbi:hypothetical protein GMA7_64 [Gordonia phage GMA7]|uniref:Uncharacterized protein n=1 Tax=Gordonia phage GMA7 TaxID=1647286 RepID=A0A0K0N774_9CAUD|nr:hypothetical protein AU104_gp054 [Gordonia phage GMA7]AKJ72501.1 hypothetical protein GMA7_64 [Gordonia phage GMA7]
MHGPPYYYGPPDWPEPHPWEEALQYVPFDVPLTDEEKEELPPDPEDEP